MSRKKILFLSPYPLNTAPSQRLKYEQYYPYFEEAGYELTTSSFVTKEFWRVIYQPGHYPIKVFFTFLGYGRRILDLFRLRRFDIVYVHLWVTPIGPPIMEWLVRRFSKKLIYDIDDLVYLNDKREKNRIMLLIRGRQKAMKLMKVANHVICCTPMLESFVRKFNDKVTDISSTIDTSLYEARTDYVLHSPPVLGWSGSHSTSRYLHLLAEPLRKLRASYPFILKVIGAPSFEMEGVEVKAVEWNSESEVEELQEFDIGLYPLPLDEEWVNGKSGLKALQYMALGIPTIATAVGANFRIIENGKNGILIKDGDWEEQIKRLLQMHDFRKSLGQAAMITVKKQYSLESSYEYYLSVLREVIK